MIISVPRNLGRLRLRKPQAVHRTSRRSWNQVACFCLIGLAVLVSSWHFSESSGKWQEAVREELRQAFTLQETVRRVYGEEAPLAFNLTVAASRAEGLHEVRSLGSAAMSEYVVANRTETHLRSQAEAGTLASDLAYSTQLGYDVLRRLADSLTNQPRTDPAKTRATADRHALSGTIAAWAGMAIAVLGAIGAIIRRRVAEHGSSREDNVDLIPQPLLVSRSLLWPTALKLACWLLLGILPLSQLLLAAEEQRQQADAAVSATHISSAIFVSNQRTSFLADSRQQVIALEVDALARQFASLGTSVGPESGAQQAVALVDARVARHAAQVAEEMGRPAREGDRLESTVIAALNSQPGDWPAALQEQNRHVSLAEQSSGRGVRVITSTALVALASALAAVAATGPTRNRRSTTVWTIVALTASVAIAVSGVWA